LGNHHAQGAVRSSWLGWEDAASVLGSVWAGERCVSRTRLAWHWASLRCGGALVSQASLGWESVRDPSDAGSCEMVSMSKLLVNQRV